MRRNPRILVIDDEPAVRQAVGSALRGEGYEVHDAPDASTVDEVLRRFRPDLAILDVRLPSGPTGLQVARRLRLEADLPIMFVTAADSELDRLTGFEAGADDYLVKPFSMPELLARVRVALRRTGRVRSSVVEVGPLVIDERSAVVTVDGHDVELTNVEYRLLQLFAENRGQILSKRRVLQSVWGNDALADNLVEVHVSALRRKLERHAPRILHTVRGMGYVLRP